MNTFVTTPAPTGPGILDRLLRFAEARMILGLSKSTMYRLLERGELPRPIKIGVLTYFSEREVQAWIAGKLAERGREVVDD